MRTSMARNDRGSPVPLTGSGPIAAMWGYASGVDNPMRNISHPCTSAGSVGSAPWSAFSAAPGPDGERGQRELEVAQMSVSKPSLDEVFLTITGNSAESPTRVQHDHHHHYAWLRQGIAPLRALLARSARLAH